MSSTPGTSTGVRLDDDRRRRRRATLLVVIGLAVFAHPLYLWPHYGQTAVGVRTVAVTGTPTAAIDSEALPPAARTALEEAVSGGNSLLWTGEHDDALETLEGATVRYEGRYYRVLLTFDHGGGFGPVLLRWLGTAASVFLVVYGGLVLYGGTWRPLTPLRSVWIPAGVGIGVLVTATYDVAVSGAARSIRGLSGSVVGLDLILLVPIGALFAPIGAELAREHPRWRWALGGAAGVCLLAGGWLGPADPSSVLTMAVLAGIAGVPWAVLAHRLSSEI